MVCVLTEVITGVFRLGEEAMQNMVVVVPGRKICFNVSVLFCNFERLLGVTKVLRTPGVYQSFKARSYSCYAIHSTL